MTDKESLQQSEEKTPDVVEETAKETVEKPAQNATETTVEEAVQQHDKAHRYRTFAVVGILVVIVLGLVSAFVWPGWALQPASNSSATASGKDAVVAVTPVALPSDATTLTKILPDTVGTYARGELKTTTVWDSSSPIEQYEVTYTTGDSQADITVTFAQWSTSTQATGQYDALRGALTAGTLASGKVHVGGQEMGDYEIHADEADSTKSVVVWRNDTVVFEAKGPKSAVNAFYAGFPY